MQQTRVLIVMKIWFGPTTSLPQLFDRFQTEHTRFFLPAPSSESFLLKKNNNNKFDIILIFNLGTEGKRGTTIRSSTDEIFETLGITKLDKENNQCIRQKTGAQNIVKEIKQYQKKWLQHVQRMDTNRIPKQALQYEPKGRRKIGRPKKRWRE